MAHAEVDVRKVGLAGEAYVAEPVALTDSLAFIDADGPLLQVAILRFPAISVIDEDTVAAFAAFDTTGLIIADEDVGDAITTRLHNAVSCCKNGYARRRRSRGKHTEICSCMSVVGCSATCEIAHAWTGIEINEILDKACRAGIAGQRQSERRPFSRGCGEPEGGS